MDFFFYRGRIHNVHHGNSMSYYDDFLDNNLSRHDAIKSTNDWIWSLSDEKIFELSKERKLDVDARSLIELRSMLVSYISFDKVNRMINKKD